MIFANIKKSVSKKQAPQRLYWVGLAPLKGILGRWNTY